MSTPLEAEPQPFDTTLTLLRSLIDSRRTWLSSIFIKSPTSTDGTSEPNASQPSLSNFTLIGTCSLEAGPHIFHDVQLFEVRYRAVQSHSVSSPYRSYRLYNTSPHFISGAEHSSNGQSTIYSNPGLPPLSTSQELIDQVTAASEVDPSFKRLLEVAAAGNATKDELDQLGRRIQDVSAKAADRPFSDPSLRSKTYESTSLPEAEYLTDVVFEFGELPHIKWILPLEKARIERKHHSLQSIKDGDDPQTSDIWISQLLPINNTRFPREPLKEPSECQPVTLKLIGAPSSLWTAILKTAPIGASRVARQPGVTLEEMIKHIPVRTYIKCPAYSDKVTRAPDKDNLVTTAAVTAKDIHKETAKAAMRQQKRKYVSSTSQDLRSQLQAEVVTHTGDPRPSIGAGQQSLGTKSNAAWNTVAISQDQLTSDQRRQQNLYRPAPVTDPRTIYAPGQLITGPSPYQQATTVWYPQHIQSTLGPWMYPYSAAVSSYPYSYPYGATIWPTTTYTAHPSSANRPITDAVEGSATTLPISSDSLQVIESIQPRSVN